MSRSRKIWKFLGAIFAYFKNYPSQTVATAQIAPKICQACPTFGSHCSRFHPNGFTFRGVIAERVKTVLPRIFLSL